MVFTQIRRRWWNLCLKYTYHTDIPGLWTAISCQTHRSQTFAGRRTASSSTPITCLESCTVKMAPSTSPRYWKSQRNQIFSAWWKRVKFQVSVRSQPLFTAVEGTVVVKAQPFCRSLDLSQTTTKMPGRRDSEWSRYKLPASGCLERAQGPNTLHIFCYL